MLEQRAVMALLLTHGAMIEVGDRKGRTALNRAVLSGNCKIVREVLEHKAKRG